MKTINQIIKKLAECNISVYTYKENGKICGYELNTYTDGGVNQIVFVDFRDTNKDPKSPKDFIELYNDRVDSIDIDEEIDSNRQDKSYRESFSISVSLKDFTDWKNELQSIFKK